MKAVRSVSVRFCRLFIFSSNFHKLIKLYTADTEQESCFIIKLKSIALRFLVKGRLFMKSCTVITVSILG